MTIIHSNGSKLAGERPDSLDTLLEIPANYRLDSETQPFITRNPRGSVDTGRGKLKFSDLIYRNNMTRFSGNFTDISHVFRIDTNDSALIKILSAAIHANKRAIEDQEVLF